VRWAVTIGAERYREDPRDRRRHAGPDFELRSDDDDTVKLSALRGRQVVLYFYPKDDTPGS